MVHRTTIIQYVNGELVDFQAVQSLPVDSLLHLQLAKTVHDTFI